MAGAGGPGGVEVGRISVRVVPDMDKFWSELYSKLKSAVAAINRNPPKVKVGVDLDTNGLRSKLDAATKGVHKAKVGVDVDAGAARAKIVAATKALPNAHVKVEVDRNFLSRQLSSVGEMFSRNLSFERITPNIAGFGGIASLGILAAGLSLLAPALALVSTGLLALPGLIMGVAGPLGVLALGFGGIKNALEASGLISIITGSRGGKKTAMGDAIVGIREQISQVFEQGFTPLFTRVAAVLPQLTQGLPFIANGIVNFFSGITDALTSGANIDRLDRMTNSIGTMMTNLGPGVESFTNAMVRLTTDVTDHLPGLGNFVSKMAGQFSGWISKIDMPDDSGGPSVLDKAISNLAPVLESVLNGVGRLVDIGVNMMADPKMMNNIVKFLDDLGAAIAGIMPALSGIFNAIANSGILKAIANVGRLFGGGAAKDAFDTGTGFDSGSILNQINSGASINPALPSSGLTSGGSGSFLFGGDAIDAPSVDSGKQAGAGFTQGFFDATKQALAPNLPKALPGAQQGAALGGSIGSGFAGMPSGIPAPSAVAPAPAAAPPPQAVKAPDTSAATAALSGLAAKTSSAMSGVQAAVESAMSAAVGIVKSKNAEIVASFTALGAQITGAVKGIAAQMVSAGQAIGQGLAAGINAGKAAAVAAAQSMAAEVAAAARSALAIKSPSGVFAEIGNQSAAGFQQGLEGGFQGVIERSRQLAGQVAQQMKDGVMPDKGAISKQLQEISLEGKELRVQRDQLDKGDPRRKDIASQLDQLSVMRRQLDLQGSQIGAGKQADEQQRSQAAQMATDAINKAVGIASNFGVANFNESLTALGGSGQGALPQLLTQGLGMGTQFMSTMLNKMMGGGGAGGSFGGGGGATTINVNSVDDAMQAKQTMDNRKALQYAGR